MTIQLKKSLAICFLLAATTSIVYLPVYKYDFLNYDDNEYVTKNTHVTSGLTPENIFWAFSSVHSANWHPITWISHMVDCELFGLDAGRHHLTNLILHIVNTLLLFAVFTQMTKRLWSSAFVAAVFALHPLHTESVAWIAERKDVLCTLFGLLTVAAYLRYVKKHDTVSYLLMLLAFTLGLMAKPMLVTLPFVLLLLDYWPLERFKEKEDINSNQPIINPNRQLVLEKLPLFILSATSSIITYSVQQSWGAVKQTYPLGQRIANAAVSYIAYIGKTLWPRKLAIFYPHPEDSLALWKVAVAASLLIGISVLVIIIRKKHRYLPAGWLWFVITLVPVTGLVQVGDQAMADRYMYIPLIGLSIMIVWGFGELTQKMKYRQIVSTAAIITVPGLLSVQTHIQQSYWKDNETVFKHALEVTKDNYAAYYELARVFYRQGDIEKALQYYNETLRIKPDTTEVYENIAAVLVNENRLDEAAENYKKALEINPKLINTRRKLAYIFVRQNRLDEAIPQFYRILEGRRTEAKAYDDLGNALLKTGRIGEAAFYLRKSLLLDPQYTSSLTAMAQILATHPDPNFCDPNEAVGLASRAAELTDYQNPVILETLSTAYEAEGNIKKAKEIAQAALVLAEKLKAEKLAEHLRKKLAVYNEKLEQNH
jgi:tetratricopeptide (TPR) repeat protein